MQELTRVFGSEMPLEIELINLTTNLPLDTTVGYTWTIWAKATPKAVELLFSAVTGTPAAGGLVIFDPTLANWQHVPLGKSFWYVKGVFGGRCRVLEKFEMIQEQ
jgi:hypothetical protein